MELQMIDLAMPLFFLSALILVAKFKKQLADKNAGSYLSISAGLVILAMATLSRVYSSTGVFNAIPFLSVPLFYQLLFWIGIITGLTFLLSGVSSWLPLSQTYQRHVRMRLKHLELIKKVEQLVGIERSLSVILNQALRYMVEHYGLLKGAAYAYSRKQKKLLFLSSSGSAAISEAHIKDIIFDDACEEKLLENGALYDGQIVKEVPEDVARPNLVLPVVVNGKLSSLFLLWHEEKAVWNNEDKVNLKIAADIIARKVVHDKVQIMEDFRTQQQEWLQSFCKVVDSARNIKENLPRIARWLTKLIPAELISLTVVYDHGNVQRFSTGVDGTLLAEKGIDLYSNHFLQRIFERGEPLVVKDVWRKTTVPVDDLIRGSGMRSLIVFPLTNGKTNMGAVVVGSRLPNHFDARKIELIKSAIPLLNSLLSQEIYRYELNLTERRIDLLDSFLVDCGKNAGLQKLFELAAGLLSKTLNTSVVRISTYDHDGSFLRSRALSLLRPIEGITPANGHMILSLMPYHTLVRDSGQPMLINQQDSDKKISEAEAKQMAGSDLKSALLVPIKVGQEVPAVISLAELRGLDRYRYTQADIQFADSVASALSLAIQMNLSRKTKLSVKSSRDWFAAASIHDADVRSRIKSSLSGILGSVEMIKSHAPETDTSLERYLSIIDRSAQRISAYFTEESSQ